MARMRESPGRRAGRRAGWRGFKSPSAHSPKGRYDNEKSYRPFVCPSFLPQPGVRAPPSIDKSRNNIELRSERECVMPHNPLGPCVRLRSNKETGSTLVDEPLHVPRLRHGVASTRMLKLVRDDAPTSSLREPGLDPDRLSTRVPGTEEVGGHCSSADREPFDGCKSFDIHPASQLIRLRSSRLDGPSHRGRPHHRVPGRQTG